MKRLIFLPIIVFLALQFTCGHVSSKGIEPTKHDAKCYQSDCEALKQMNAANAEFWRVSCRIDSLLNKKNTRAERIELVRASPPVHN
jgi:hypothetical protein